MPAINRLGPRSLPANSFGMLVTGAVAGGSQAINRGQTSMGVDRYRQPRQQPPRYTISGITKDSTGAVLGNCTIEVFEKIPGNANEPKGRLVGMTTSDANGNYRVDVYSAVNATFQVDAYKAGSPDVAGTTLNTLIGTPN